MIRWARSRRQAGHLVCVAGAALAATPLLAAEGDAPARVLTYQTPETALVDLVDAPRPPEVSVGPNRRWLLVMEPAPTPSIEAVSRPEVLLAGYRIDPRTNGPIPRDGARALTFQALGDTLRHPVTSLPAGVVIDHVQWSPNGLYAAFTVNDGQTVELWVTETEGTVTKRVLRQPLNALNVPFRWTPDSKALVCTIIPEDRPPAPSAPPVPTGPIVRQREGGAAPAPYRDDLLRTPHDEVLFEHYLASQLLWAEVGGKRKRLGSPGIINTFSVSPDGRYLLVQLIHRPFSFYVPAAGFPQWIEIWDLEGNRVQRIADVPARETAGAPPGPRDFQWRADAPSTVAWVDAAKSAAASLDTDAVVALDAPFEGEPRVLAAVPGRVAGIAWGNDGLALVREAAPPAGPASQAGPARVWWIQPGKPGTEPRPVSENALGSPMGHPGRFVTDPNAQGERVLLTPPEGATLYRFGDEDTAEGSRPFVAAVDLETGTSRRLWQSAGSVYEEPRFLLDAGGARLITRRETPEEPPNFILHSLDSGAERPLTAFANPHPALSAPPREVIRAGGEGGKTIRGLLARPAAADSAGPPPLLLWIRPSEPGGGAVSPYRFEPSGPASPFVWATQGFAVLVVSDLPVSEDAAAPAEPPAGSFVNAALAMVDTATGKWGADRRRVAVGGDGDGAAAVPVFLARDPRFRAGIASGGAYNPAFKWPGFEDKEPIPVLASGVSEGNSSLRLAFSRPLLLLQGEADADRARNAERSFGALTGLDAPARLVLFPHERAPLRARESILHALWETREWLLAHVANSGPGSRNSGKP